MSIKIGIGKKTASTTIAPSGLTLTLISGGVRVSFTDNTGGIAQTEIWGRSDSGVSALLTTKNAGVVTHNDIVSPVDLRYYKIRAKNGSNYSAFTTEVSIAMLGANLVVNGTFDTWVGNTPTGWTVVASDGTHYFSNGGGVCLVENPSYVNLRMRQSILTIGKTYLVRVNTGGYSVGAASFLFDGGSIDLSGNGNYSGIVLVADTYLMFLADTVNSGFYIDNVKAQEVLNP